MRLDVERHQKVAARGGKGRKEGDIRGGGEGGGR